MIGYARLLLGVLLMLASSATWLRAQLSPGPLARAHTSLEGTTNCVKCHALNRAPMATACLSCHTDVQRLVAAKRGYHARLTSAQRGNCASCHPDHAGADFDLIDWGSGGRNRFDHKQAGWALEGKHAAAKCESCHATKYRTDPVATVSKRKTGTPWIGLPTSCASCHRTDDVHKGELKGSCASCHDAKAWSPAPRFDHDSARYRLTGKHVDVKCASCHETARLPVVRNTDGERVGLFRPVPYARCSDCHTDPHKGRIREACTTCHNTRGWDAVETKGFEHGATRYPLRGRHARVSCAACHGRNNERPTPAFSTCASCHQDVHRGESVQRGDCASCHTVENFAPSTFTVTAHAATAYPLAGRHRQVKCAACHTTQSATTTGANRAVTTSNARVVRLRMPFASCTDCHTDVHGGQPATRTANATCATCHDVDGFSPSHITVSQHASYRLPLTGAHARTTCVACHSTKRAGLPAPTLRTPHAIGSAGFAFAIGDTNCVACHADPHGGKYGRRATAAGSTCTACHSVDRFRPSTISVATHGAYGFAIDGAHQAVSCADCHREMSVAPRPSSLRLPAITTPTMAFTASTPRACASCHTEAHGGQFAGRRDRGACESCHATDRFVGASRFDHERSTTFPLSGAHATVTCARCHTPLDPSRPGNTALRRYAGLSGACESCHAAKGGVD